MENQETKKKKKKKNQVLKNTFKDLHKLQTPQNYYKTIISIFKSRLFFIAILESQQNLAERTQNSQVIYARPPTQLLAALFWGFFKEIIYKLENHLRE